MIYGSGNSTTEAVAMYHVQGIMNQLTELHREVMRDEIVRKPGNVFLRDL